MPKSNKFSLGGPDSMQFPCGTQNRYFGPPAFPDSVLFQNTIPNPPTFDYPLPRSSLSARRHRNIRTSQNTSAKSPQCSISITNEPKKPHKVARALVWARHHGGAAPPSPGLPAPAEAQLP